MANIERGAVVFVNANKDRNDGHYGLHTVLRVDGDDVALARGKYDSTPDAEDVDVWINRCRLTVCD